MALPIAGAALGSIALAKYLNARFHITNDLRTIGFPPVPIDYALFLRRKTLEKRMLVYHILEDQALREHPDHVFLWFEGKTWTYREFFDCVTRVGNWLMKDLGIKVGEIVALDGGNSPEHIMLRIALDGIGAVHSLVNNNLTSNSLVHCLKLCETRILLADTDIKPLVDPYLSQIEAAGIKTIFYDPALVSTMTDTTPLPESRRSDFGPESLKGLIYTSGTTGNPKATKFLAGREMAMGRMVSQRLLDLKPGDRIYTCMPLYHGAAHGLAVNPAIHAGATICLGRKFSHKTFWPEVRASEANIVQYVGELCRYLVNAPPSPRDKDHKVQVAWGNGMRPDVWEVFRERFGIPVIHELYAASDGLGSSFNANKGEFTRNAIGLRGSLVNLLKSMSEVMVKIDPDTEEFIRDKNGFAIKCGVNEPGEVIQKVAEEEGPLGFAGYYANQIASDKRKIRNVFKKGDIWFRSGDAMRLDADGRLYFVDRLGDTFRWKSENVSTNEVGDVLGLFPQVAEANVYGIQVPRADGRCGCAALVFREGVTEQNFDFTGLARHALASLPRYAVPIFVRVVPKLDYTGTMKMQKGRYRKEGADPEIVSDALYWLPPGKDQYIQFHTDDFKALETGVVNL